MVSVPASTREITAEWLTSALRSSADLQSAVSSVEVETIGAGVGLMGELARLHLQFEGQESLPGTIIAKCAAQNENRQVAQILDFYNREANFYNRLGGECPLRIPRSFYADVNQESYDFVLLMEDLGEVSPRDQLVGAAEEEVISAIERIAEMHGKWWGISESTHGWMYPNMSREEAGKLSSMVYAPALDSALEKFDYLLTEDLKTVCRSVGENFHEVWSDNMLCKADTFIHGDYRQDNMLYNEGNPDALVMDWQISGRGKGVFDIAYFMCQSVQSELRREIEKEVIDRYCARLQAQGIDYPPEQCFEDYRRVILGCLIYPVTVCGSLDLANERGKALAECMFSRNLQAILDLGSAELL